MSFCGAIEMVSKNLSPTFSTEAIYVQAGIVTFKTSIIKGGVEKFALKQPIFVVCAIS